VVSLLDMVQFLLYIEIILGNIRVLIGKDYLIHYKNYYQELGGDAKDYGDFY
jgi:hypothetical protein